MLGPHSLPVPDRATLRQAASSAHAGPSCRSGNLPVPTRRSRGYAGDVPTWRLASAPWLRAPREVVRGPASALLVALFVLAGCGGSHISLQGPRPTPGTGSGTTSSSASNVSVPSDNGEDPAILGAYRASLDDFNTVATRVPVQGNSLTLADHMEGQQLQFVTSQLLKLAEAGQVDTGALSSIAARVKQFAGDQAVVEACEGDTVQVISSTTGQVVGPAAPTTELVNVLMQRSNGVWKVTTSSNVSPGCS